MRSKLSELQILTCCFTLLPLLVLLSFMVSHFFIWLIDLQMPRVLFPPEAFLIISASVSSSSLLSQHWVFLLPLRRPFFLPAYLALLSHGILHFVFHLTMQVSFLFSKQNLIAFTDSSVLSSVCPSCSVCHIWCDLLLLSFVALSLVKGKFFMSGVFISPGCLGHSNCLLNAFELNESANWNNYSITYTLYITSLLLGKTSK